MFNGIFTRFHVTEKMVLMKTRITPAPRHFVGPKYALKSTKNIQKSINYKLP